MPVKINENVLLTMFECYLKKQENTVLMLVD